MARRLTPREVYHLVRKRLRKGRFGVDYECEWDVYAASIRQSRPGITHIGDEWDGRGMGVAADVDYPRLIEERFIAPNVQPGETVLEIGVGGGRTGAMILRHADRLIEADISEQMLREARTRLGSDRAEYVKLDGRTLDPIADAAADVWICYDTMVHIEPRDIFNYLVRIPPKLRGRRRVLVHHTNTLSELGFGRYLREWDKCLMGNRARNTLSVMTPDLMERFLTHLGYEILTKDQSSLPRDCVWTATAPERIDPARLRPESAA
jgi:SAM-dependent methyltransferase